ncbi:MAG: sulfur oxidation c-type cytochrome SoxX [Geminicoccaceae bacterium]|nr:sulfur oxidation c-type cytochrome SoxX [Geminicoccaceae bacterium]
MRRLLVASLLMLSASGAFAAEIPGLPKISTERREQLVRDGFRYDKLPPELRARIDQDETQRLCTEYRNEPPPEVAAHIEKLARDSIVFPQDGIFLGDWKKGEALSLSGYGLRMGDDPKRQVGGNCYACHEMSPIELSYGTLGPSLKAYGKLRDYDQEAIKEAYIKIYNPNATVACSTMPRFGTNKILSIDDIRHILAFLFDPESPVNRAE